MISVELVGYTVADLNFLGDERLGFLRIFSILSHYV